MPATLGRAVRSKPRSRGDEPAEIEEKYAARLKTPLTRG